MKVHQGALHPGFQKEALQVIKEHRTVGKGEEFLPPPKIFPSFCKWLIFFQDRLPGVPAEEHLADDRLEAPQAAGVAKVNAVGTARVLLECLQDSVALLPR
jgi:hypothetical protein